MQVFDLEIKDKKESENLVANHLSQLEHEDERVDNQVSINESFPDEKVLAIQSSNAPWYADYANYPA